MSVINISIVCDGTSDLCISDLIYAIADETFPSQAFRVTAAREVIPAHGALGLRLKRAYKEYEPQILVCHRDAEALSMENRATEITKAIAIAGIPVPIVSAVPVRMIESWLLTNELAIRCAADNRNGNIDLNLPRIRVIEQLNDPKELLFSALKTASNLTTQRMKKFDAHRARSRVASFIEDFNELRKLPSYLQFENDLIKAIKKLTKNQT